uniref:DUF6538 domain-containing protein n=1 Tax=OCS116 cluster bacterium TaxID=2030921 RepID=A0A2A4Z5X6_9PROT
MASKKDYLWSNDKGVWHYLRKIPNNVIAITAGGQIFKSLKTTDKAIAKEKAKRMNVVYQDE